MQFSNDCHDTSSMFSSQCVPQPVTKISLICLCLLFLGCRSESTPDTAVPDPSIISNAASDPSSHSDSPRSSESDLSQTESRRIPGRNLAIRAKDQLAASLMSRLVQAMGEGGPIGAIKVCSQEAPEIAERIGRENGVRIGRTSFRIRNPKNSPPAWALSWVEQKVDSAQFQILDSGATAALFPIRIQPTCLTCHGRDIQPEVLDQVARLYPDDHATGFALDDLRGWFWVEVDQSLPEMEH
jgi:hypothetical protein